MSDSECNLGMTRNAIIPDPRIAPTPALTDDEAAVSESDEELAVDLIVVTQLIMISGAAEPNARDRSETMTMDMSCDQQMRLQPRPHVR